MAEDTYTVNVESKKTNGNTWIIGREADGIVTRTCDPGTAGECPTADPDTGNRGNRLTPNRISAKRALGPASRVQRLGS